MCPKPVAEDPRLTKCLAATCESKAIEVKEQYVPTDPRQSLEILKDYCGHRQFWRRTRHRSY
jgi:hypothetical protein